MHVLKEMLDTARILHPDTGKPITYGFYYGKQGMNRQTHKALLAESAKSDIVLGIDIIAKEGLDIPDRNTLVWSTPPGVEIEQPAGRILRKYHKDINPMIIDIVDNTGNFPNHSRERDKWFTDEDYVIHDHTVELLGPQNWEEHLTEYIHKMKMTTMVKKRKTPVKVKEIDLTECHLTMAGDAPKPKPKPVIKKTSSSHSNAPAPVKAPDNNLCYLGFTCKSSDDERSNGPDTGKCLI